MAKKVQLASISIIEVVELTKFSAPGRLALLARFTASSRLFNCMPKLCQDNCITYASGKENKSGSIDVHT